MIAVHTPPCRYHWNQERLEAEWDGDYAEELYDHRGDNSTSFDPWDNANLAQEYPAKAKQLKRQLETFFRRH